MMQADLLLEPGKPQPERFADLGKVDPATNCRPALQRQQRAEMASRRSSVRTCS
jgi:hypothetical protein